MMALLIACGGGGGGGGGSSSSSSSTGGSDTGTIVSASVVPESVNVDYCTESASSALATLGVISVNSKLPANTLQTESYKLTFSSTDPGAPAISGGTFNDSRTLPASDFAVQFIDTPAKQAVRAALAGSGASYAYQAKYKFTGEDLYGTTWTSTATVSFNMGQYSPCPMAVYPSSITIQGVNDPADPSDNIVFAITGGTGPYTVYSNSALIEAPGALGPAVASFAVNPSGVAEPSTVTLTVADALGALATAIVTLIP